MREGALKKGKHHLLFIGSRGSGKTHLLALINSRLEKLTELQDRLRIAWLNEDETSTSFLDLLVRIYRALSDRYPQDFPSSDLENVYGMEADQARESLGASLIRLAKKRAILVMVENLDGLFRQLDAFDQKAWRAFIQNHPIFTTVATAQSLFGGVSDSGQPFFGFFDIRHLAPLTVDEAKELLVNIANLEPRDEGLAAFLATPGGRARLRAIHHLSGGNHRLYIVLSELITKESLEELVRPFEEMVDEQLTPYYQERLRWLSPLQRKIVEFLCFQARPVPVKDIADRLFTSHSSITPQLKQLREMGYVISHPRGREALYELTEPLMRLSMQVKDTPQRQPLGLLVDFLRVWYEREELLDRLAKTGHNVPGCEYIAAALARIDSGEPNLRHVLLRQALEGVELSQCADAQFQELRELAEDSREPSDVINYGVACASRKSFPSDFEETVSSALAQTRKSDTAAAEALLYLFRAIARRDAHRLAEAADDCNRAAEASSTNEHLSACLYIQAGILVEMQHLGEAEAVLDRCIALDDISNSRRAECLSVRAKLLNLSGRGAEASRDLTHLLEMSASPPDERAAALVERASIFAKQARFAEALVDIDSFAKLEGISDRRQKRARRAAVALLFTIDDWNNAVERLRSVLDSEADQMPFRSKVVCEKAAVDSISRHIASPTVWRPRVRQLVELYAKRERLTDLANGLVQHLSELKDSPLNRAGLDAWVDEWTGAAASYPAMHLALRLLRVGIEYIASGKNDEGILLQLPQEERSLLRQALQLSPD